MQNQKEVSEWAEIIDLLSPDSDVSAQQAVRIRKYSLRQGLLYFENRLCIPPGPLRSELLKENHDNQTAGQTGAERTYLKHHRRYYWKGMYRDVKKYVQSCDNCQRTKPSLQKNAGLLQPLPIPDRPWCDISMDFIMELPASQQFNAIMVVVDRLTKMAHFVLMNTSATAPQVAKLVFDHIFRYHGLPRSIVSDQDARFTSSFWKELLRLCQIKQAMSTSYHPQTDGQTEIVNRQIA